jgi:hypothetical protein
MARTIKYEWQGEVIAIDEDGDEEVLETVTVASYAEAQAALKEITPQVQLVTLEIALVRCLCEGEEEIDWEYAYVQDDNRLPHTFRNGTAVPLKYRQEVDTYHKRVEWARYEATTSIADLLTEYDQAREQADRAQKHANWCVEQRSGPAEDREYFYEMSQASRAEAQRWTDRMAAIGLRLDVLLPNRPAEV